MSIKNLILLCVVCTANNSFREIENYSIVGRCNKFLFGVLFKKSVQIANYVFHSGLYLLLLEITCVFLYARYVSCVFYACAGKNFPFLRPIFCHPANGADTDSKLGFANFTAAYVCVCVEFAWQNMLLELWHILIN